MADTQSIGKVERVYLQYTATGIKCARLKEELHVDCMVWGELLELSDGDQSLPSRYAKYNELFKMLQSHARLSLWLSENLAGKGKEFTDAVKKYGDMTEDEFVEAFRKFKEQG